MSIQAMLTQLRVEVDDLDKTRWTDDQLKVFLGKSVRRVNQLVVRHELDFGMRHDTVTMLPDGTIDGIDYQDVNAVCMLVLGDGKEVKQLYPSQYATVVDPGQGNIWTFINGQAVYKTPFPEEAEATFIYYPRMSLNTTESPWDGRLDDIVVEYAAFRAKNVDEMNAQADQQMMAELENRLLENYARLNPQIAYMRGWVY
jgi:hypothetical protein